LYLPVFDIENADQYIGFFHTGAYQESLGGYGGIQHCLIPAPQHVLVNLDAEGNITTELFADEQDSNSMMEILGYKSHKKKEMHTIPGNGAAKKNKKTAEDALV
jgi:arginine decarboxylase